MKRHTATLLHRFVPTKFLGYILKAQFRKSTYFYDLMCVSDFTRLASTIHKPLIISYAVSMSDYIASNDGMINES
jgi:hypothetical protein